MKNNVVETARKVKDNGEQLARNVWLASLGIYSKSLEEAQQLNSKTNKVFDELVEKGKEIESATRGRLVETKNIASASVEDRVNDLFYKLSGLDKRQLNEMNEKLDKLSKSVDELVQES